MTCLMAKHFILQQNHLTLKPLTEQTGSFLCTKLLKRVESKILPIDCVVDERLEASGSNLFDCFRRARYAEQKGPIVLVKGILLVCVTIVEYILSSSWFVWQS